MKKIRKLLSIFVILLILVPASAKGWQYSGIGGGGTGTFLGGGVWHAKVLGVRATAVTQDGKRLSLNINNQKYESISIDFYGSSSDIDRFMRGYNYKTLSFSSCRTSTGVTTFCSKPELENGNLTGTEGNYNYQIWPYQNVMPIPVGMNIDNRSTVTQLYQSLSKMGTSGYKAQADDLFERLMGHSVAWFQQHSGGHCEENKETLTNAFIIFEPLSSIGSFIGTASELAILYNNDKTYNWSTLQQMYNALRVDPAVGNVGLTYFSPVGEMAVTSSAARNQMKNAVANTHLGYGVALLSYGQTFIDPNANWACYDYTIDAACVNCNSNDSENKAYIIQDTNDWNAIFASKTSSNSNVVSYYNKGNGVYCREEYTVYLPNVNNTIYVEPGRYFTVNPSAAALDKVASSAAIPSMKPIKVVKKRQCRVNSEENRSDATTVLNNFRVNSEYDFKGKTGTVKFRYNETYADSRYNMDDAEVLSTYDENGNYTYSINSGTLNMQVTKYYTLPSNYYQYIRKQDGLSMKVKPSANINYYINVGIPNLPVSFNNTGSSTSGDVSKAADIQFTYELPGKNNDTDKYSQLYKAYIKDNSYLATESETMNIYKKYVNNQMADGDQELLNNSACAKMFGMNTTGFNSCVSQRVNNAIGEGANNCITKNEISTSTTSGYSCVVLTYGNGNDDNCKTESDANRLGRDWNPLNQSCCPVGTTYNPSLGKCETDGGGNGDKTCRVENGKYYDFDGNEITKAEYDRICPNPGDGDVCRIENGKYYDFNGNEITKDEYDRICPDNIPPTCPSDCPYGCCPSGECAPMPDGTCPGTGGIDVIYRTIDLENPFPGQNAEQRNTGANWCSYNIKTQQIDCKYNNQTVKNYITRERGGTVNGGKVYRENHVLYEVTLDTKTINSIRNYNDKNKYDDWDLNCLDNGKACISDFLKSQVSTTGECANVSKSNFYTCDKDV